MSELPDQRLGKDETKINEEVPAERKVVTGTDNTRKEGSLFSFKNILLVFVVIAFTVGIALFVEVAVAVIVIGLIFLIILVATIAAGIYSVYTFFAPNDLFFTGVREGTAKMVMVGTKENPKFVRAEISYKGFKLDQNQNVIPGKEKHYLFPGIRFIGIPGIHWVWKYDFDWSSMLQNGTVKENSKELNYIDVKKDIYVARLLEAEVGESMVPVDIALLLTVEITNPYKALFKVENWLEFVINRIKVPVRDYVARENNPRNLIIKRDALGKLFLDELEKSGDIAYFENEIGVKVSKIETFDIDLGDWQETATEQWKATQKGEAEVIKKTKEGEAYKKKRKQEKEADVDYLQGLYSEIEKFGDRGTTWRFLDTLAKAAEGPGNTIIPFGMIQDIARQVLGTKSSEIVELLGEDITKEDIENLKKVVKSMREASKEEEE